MLTAPNVYPPSKQNVEVDSSGGGRGGHGSSMWRRLLRFDSEHIPA
eukprot:gene11939-biopygen2693